MKERGRGVGEVVEEVEKKGQKQVGPPKKLKILKFTLGIPRNYCPFGQNEIKNLKIARWIFF